MHPPPTFFLYSCGKVGLFSTQRIFVAESLSGSMHLWGLIVFSWVHEHSFVTKMAFHSKMYLL